MNIFLRYLEVLLFVFTYVVIGFAFHLNANQYLAVGIPLAFIFQLFVRRQPIVSVWVRNASEFRLDRTGIFIAIVLAMVPLWIFYQEYALSSWDQNLWYVISVLGAIPAAFCIRNLEKQRIKELFYCLLIAGGIGISLQLIFQIGFAHKEFSADKPISLIVLEFLFNLLLLFNVVFIVEEVIFRGILDSHVYRLGESKSWLSAIFVSMLWGLWHLPITAGTATSPLATAVILVIFQTFVGVPLSLFWRRSQNLAVPGFAHAFNDAFRNVSSLFIR